MKRRFIKIIGILMMFCIAVMLTACSEAEMVNYNMSKQADYFECEREKSPFIMHEQIISCLRRRDI